MQYLQTTYFQEPPTASVGKLYKRLTAAGWGSFTFLLSGFWYGILGTAPGTGIGSQTIEARHSQWHTHIRKTARYIVFTLFPTLQELFKTWRDTFEWGKTVSFTDRPREFNPCLLNGATLRQLGRSTAAQWWATRSNPNYVKTWRLTGRLEESGADTYT